MTTNKILRPIFIMCTFLTLITITSCEKEDQEPFANCIDDPTCEYFRCKVNGEWWTPYCEQGPLFGCSATDVQYYRNLNGGDLNVVAKNKNDNSSIVLDIVNIKFENDKKLFLTGNDTGFKMNDKIFKISKIEESNFIIISKIDTINFILEGNFQLQPSKDGETVNITEGSFRLPYRF